MTSRHKYIGGSVLLALIGIGIVCYLVRRKPEINVSGVIVAGDPTVSYHVKEETDMERLVRISNERIAADDAEQAAGDKL